MAVASIEQRVGKFIVNKPKIEIIQNQTCETWNSVETIFKMLKNNETLQSLRMVGGLFDDNSDLFANRNQCDFARLLEILQENYSLTEWIILVDVSFFSFSCGFFRD